MELFVEGCKMKGKAIALSPFYRPLPNNKKGLYDIFAKQNPKEGLYANKRIAQEYK